MAEEELIVKMTLQDELSRQAAAAGKNVGKLTRELDKARAEMEQTGDRTNFDRLEKEVKQATIEFVTLKRRAQEAGREVKAMEKQAVRSATRVQSAWKKLQGIMKNPLFTAATVAGVALFGKRAVEAFAQAEQSQMKLVQAYEKFGAISDVPIESMRALASELQSLTGTDDDLLAAAAATLARFDLTGTAIQGLLPLVNDFAILTGRDVVEASEAIGKAFMGNARALRELGINFTATGDRGKDLETIMAALDAKAGGTGDAFGETAAGGLARAQEAFGDLQEEIGGTLVPALTTMLRVVEPAAKFFSALPGPIKGTAIAIGVLAAAALAIGPRLATMVIGMRAAGIEATAMRTKMAAAGSVMAGPFGLALAAGSVALIYFFEQQAKANAQVQEFSDNIDAATGKLNQAGVESLTKTLLGDISEEDWEKLRGMGITIEGVTAAVIAGGDSLDVYLARLRGLAGNSTGAGIMPVAEATDVLARNMLGARKNLDDGARVAKIAADALKIAAVVTEETAEATDDFAMSAGRATNMVRDLGNILPAATYKTSDYYQALAAAKGAMDGLTQSLSDLSAAVNEWGSRDNFKKSLKEFITEPTADAARSMISNFEQAANSMTDPEQKAQFIADNVGKVESALKSSGLKVPPAVIDNLRTMDAESAAFLQNIRLARSALDALPDSKTVKFFLETYGRAPASVTYGLGDGPRHGGYTDGWVNGAGGPTSDLAPIWASRGEYVLRAGAAAALRNAIGEAGLWQLNHSDRAMPAFLDSPVPPIVAPSGGGSEPALVGAGAPVINIGEIKADSGIDVQAEVLWALRRHERIRRERS